MPWAKITIVGGDASLGGTVTHASTASACQPSPQNVVTMGGSATADAIAAGCCISGASFESRAHADSDRQERRASSRRSQEPWSACVAECTEHAVRMEARRARFTPILRASRRSRTRDRSAPTSHVAFARRLQGRKDVSGAVGSNLGRGACCALRTMVAMVTSAIAVDPDFGHASSSSIRPAPEPGASHKGNEPREQRATP